MPKIDCTRSLFASIYEQLTRDEPDHPERVGIPLHNALRINFKKHTTTEIKAQMSSIWAKGCMLMIVCVLSDLRLLPLLGGVKIIIIIIIRICAMPNFNSV